MKARNDIIEDTLSCWVATRLQNVKALQLKDCNGNVSVDLLKAFDEVARRATENLEQYE